MIIFKNGDLLKSNANLICHQVNCHGVFGAGLAKQIREQYPITYKEYMNFYYGHLAHNDTKNLLGKIKPVLINFDQYIVHMYSQRGYGNPKFDKRKYTNNEAFDKCLARVVEFAEQNNFATVAFPYKIGCGLGGADWNKDIYPLLLKYFDNSDIICEIWEL